MAQSEVLVASFACAFLGPGKKSLGGLGAETCEQGSRGQRRREWQCLTATPVQLLQEAPGKKAARIVIGNDKLWNQSARSAYESFTSGASWIAIGVGTYLYEMRAAWMT